MHPLQGDHHHLFIRQGTGLQGRAIFRTKLTFRPHSTESFTHRKMTLSMADRTSKTQKVKVLPVVGRDPEAQKQELLKVLMKHHFCWFSFRDFEVLERRGTFTSKRSS